MVLGIMAFPAGLRMESISSNRSAGKDSNNLSIINVETREVRALTTGSNHDNFPSWSPVGDRIAFTSYRDRDYEIYTIKPDGTDLRRLTKVAGNDAHNTWSPDGQWIGFADRANLKRVAISGGPPVVLASLNNTFRGATWAPDGTIVFATADTSVGLQRMPAGGGEPMVLTRPDSARGEADHFWPEFLPGGQAVLFTIMPTTGGLDQAQVAVLDP